MSGKWGTNEERDNRHEEVMRRFPGGLSWDQFVYCTLESARDDSDLVEFPSLVGDIFSYHRRTFKMFMDGLIVSREGHKAPMLWRITEQGKLRLAEMKAAHPEWARPT